MTLRTVAGMPVTQPALPKEPEVEKKAVKPAAVKPEEKKLPPHWRTAKDGEGKVYYYHAITRLGSGARVYLARTI